MHAKLAATAVLFARAFVRCHMEKPCGIGSSVAGEPRATLAVLAVLKECDARKLPANARGLIIAHLFVLQLAVVLQLVVINGRAHCKAQEGDASVNERGKTCGA